MGNICFISCFLVEQDHFMAALRANYKFLSATTGEMSFETSHWKSVYLWWSFRTHSSPLSKGLSCFLKLFSIFSRLLCILAELCWRAEIWNISEFSSSFFTVPSISVGPKIYNQSTSFPRVCKADWILFIRISTVNFFLGSLGLSNKVLEWP